MTQYKTQSQLVAALREQLSTNPNQATKALIFLFNRQTEEERELETTAFFNRVGFNGRDARFLTSLAKQFLKTGSLSHSQMTYLMKLIPKYAGQIVKHSLETGKIRKENGFYIW